ncbi:hypothetical protein [Chondromyces crocatus]|uniref:Uncharacterized protein n=1 Tax=Chondromyces crocatus TaxID=52 RepID=A0A0K1EL49_CHOCO|nr:hypothetical protein [Chondromyces crocatus]AKT41590.1 uncharacterized protein CMC5_057970 [Chondromyces crocatus]
MSATGRVVSTLRQARWVFAGVLGFTLLAVALIGFAHTKHGRPLLAFLRGAPGCPVGMDLKLSPAEQEQLRAQVLASVRTAERASSRPALGFLLDATTRDDVARWAADHGIRCEPAKRGAALRCADVPAAALVVEGDAAASPAHPGAVDGLMLFFDGHARLIAVDASRSQLSAEAATDLVEARRASLSAMVGPPALESGVADADYLKGGALRRVSSEFRFSDYRVQLSATNLGQKVVVREQYQSIPN